MALSILPYSNHSLVLKATLINSIVGGSVAGFLDGFVGTGGAIRGLVMAAFNLEKNFYVGTSAAIDWSVDVSRLGIYLYQGYFKVDAFWYLLLLGVAAWLGTTIGKWALSKISQEIFKKIILVLIFLTGLSIALQELLLLW